MTLISCRSYCPLWLLLGSLHAAVDLLQKLSVFLCLALQLTAFYYSKHFFLCKLSTSSGLLHMHRFIVRLLSCAFFFTINDGYEVFCLGDESR